MKILSLAVERWGHGGASRAHVVRNASIVMVLGA
jgi:hypothetical protein